jgi:hypothetical protein
MELVTMIVHTKNRRLARIEIVGETIKGRCSDPCVQAAAWPVHNNNLHLDDTHRTATIRACGEIEPKMADRLRSA